MCSLNVKILQCTTSRGHDQEHSKEYWNATKGRRIRLLVLPMLYKIVNEVEGENSAQLNNTFGQSQDVRGQNILEMSGGN